MQKRTCPVCNVELETDEVYDGAIYISQREEEWLGHCPQCGKKYHWTEVYIYKETKDFEVLNGEED